MMDGTRCPPSQIVVFAPDPPPPPSVDACHIPMNGPTEPDSSHFSSHGPLSPAIINKVLSHSVTPQSSKTLNFKSSQTYILLILS
jgi:hypothetical protein